MLRVAILNGKNKNYDRDFSKLIEAISSPGVISGLNIVDGKIQPGKAFIQVKRANTDSFYCYAENTEEITVDVTWTKKIWLEVKQANINDGSSNAPDGSGILEVKTWASYPELNFLKIASVVSWVVTDDRELITNIDDVINMIIDGLYNFGVSSVWTDSYAITLPNPPTAYEVGQTFRFQADVGNTWSASLNVNGLWAITIKKLHDQDLETWDIEAWQIVVVAYDWTNFQMNSQVAMIPVTDAALSSLSNEDFLAWENLIQWDSLFVELQPSLSWTNVDEDQISFPSANPSVTQSSWYRLQARSNIFISGITKNSSCTGTRARLLTDAGTLLATATFSWNRASFSVPYFFNTNDYFRVEIDNNWSAYSYRYNNSPWFPKTWINVIYNTASTNWSNDTTAANVDSVLTSLISLQNIWDLSWNTRLAIRAIWSWVIWTTLKLALAKVVSPSLNLNVRIETDNAGSPSGTLINANATATIAPWSLTTSLVDTTLNLAWSITIPKWTIVWLVLYVWTYWSETVNWTNYYRIWSLTNHTTTRYGKLWNWSGYSGSDGKLYYVSSWLFESQLLSKTDADYIYKLPDIPRISTADYNTWELVKYNFKWIIKSLTWLIVDALYYISNTPWALSLTEWTNIYSVWVAKNSDELLLQNNWWYNTLSWYTASIASVIGSVESAILYNRVKSEIYYYYDLTQNASAWSESKLEIQVSLNLSTWTTIWYATVVYQNVMKIKWQSSVVVPWWYYVRVSAVITGWASWSSASWWLSSILYLE